MAGNLIDWAFEVHKGAPGGIQLAAQTMPQLPPLPLPPGPPPEFPKQDRAKSCEEECRWTIPGRMRENCISMCMQKAPGEPFARLPDIGGALEKVGTWIVILIAVVVLILAISLIVR